MKGRQMLHRFNVTFLMSILILSGTVTLVFGQPRIDGYYIDTKASAETNRAMFIRNDILSGSTLIVGTNTGNSMFARVADGGVITKPVYKSFIFEPSTAAGLVRYINFLSSDKGYLLKSGGIYSTDGKSARWKQITYLKHFPQENNSIAELWGMSFVDYPRLCVVGVYLKNDGGRAIDKELLLCTDDISELTPKWHSPRMPRNQQAEPLQLTNIFFDKEQRGWAVGTDGAEGVIWYSNNGGMSWEEQRTVIEEPLLSVYGIGGNKAIAVGYNGLVLGQGITHDNSKIMPDREIRVNDEVEIIEGEFILGPFEGVQKIIGVVKEIKRNGMLRIRVKEIFPELARVKDYVRDRIENRDVRQTSVRKVGNKDSNNGGNASAEWRKIQVSSALKNPAATLRSVKFADNNLDGFIVGDKGTILYTQDGGVSWRPLTIPYPQLAAVDFYSIFIDENYCWVAGSKGTIVRIRYN